MRKKKEKHLNTDDMTLRKIYIIITKISLCITEMVRIIPTTTRHHRNRKRRRIVNIIGFDVFPAIYLNLHPIAI